MNWKKYPIILFTFCLFTGLLQAQKTSHVHGSAPDYALKVISVFSYTDFVSERKQWLTSDVVDENGSFDLEIPCAEITYIGIRCDHVTAYMYLEPQTNYRISFLSPEVGTSVTFNDKAETELIFEELELSDINSLIIDFNYRYEGFFTQNYELLQRMFAPTNKQDLADSLGHVARKAVKGNIEQLLDKMEQFALNMDTMYVEFDLPYFKSYRTAVLGDMMLNSKMDPRDFFDRFIAPRSFQAQHRAQTELQKKFYRYYFLRHAQSYGNEELGEVLNDLGSYTRLCELVSKDDFMETEVRRDIVLSMAIAEVWGNKSMEKDKLADILASIGKESKSEAASKVALDLLHVLNSNEKGFPAYSFSLYDQFNDRTSIEGLSGRPIIIQFWASWCSDCQSEQVLFDLLSNTHKNDFYFISMNMDDLEDIPSIVKRDKHVHHLLGISDPLIKESYKVNSLPFYVLIDENGLIYDYDGKRPSEGLESILLKWKKKKEETKRTIGSKEN